LLLPGPLILFTSGHGNRGWRLLGFLAAVAFAVIVFFVITALLNEVEDAIGVNQNESPVVAPAPTPP